jgi:hypothetical protein
MTCSGDTCSKPVSQPAAGDLKTHWQLDILYVYQLLYKHNIDRSCIVWLLRQTLFVLESVSACVFGDRR